MNLMKGKDFQIDDTVILILFPDMKYLGIEIGKGKIIKIRKDDLGTPIYIIKLDGDTEYSARSYELSLTSFT